MCKCVFHCSFALSSRGSGGPTSSLQYGDAPFGGSFTGCGTRGAQRGLLLGAEGASKTTPLSPADLSSWIMSMCLVPGGEHWGLGLLPEIGRENQDNALPTETPTLGTLYAPGGWVVLPAVCTSLLSLSAACQVASAPWL